jgi:hypothetical protein
MVKLSASVVSAYSLGASSEEKKLHIRAVIKEIAVLMPMVCRVGSRR